MYTCRSFSTGMRSWNCHWMHLEPCMFVNSKSDHHSWAQCCVQSGVLLHISVFFPWQRRFATAEFNKWRRCCDRLTQLQRRIKFPRIEEFTTETGTYRLPLKAVGPPARHPTEEELQYLVGFFDGDGCVSMRNKTGQIILQISQNVDSAEVLLYFRNMLGGAVYCQKSATGTAKAMLSWGASGGTARSAASMLSSAPSMKQAQLRIAARGTVSEASRAHMSHELRLLKQKEHKPDNFQCSWSYLAGFFDAEGSITVLPNWAGLQIELWQMNRFVLEAVLSFLHREDSRLKSWRLQEATCSPKLACRNLETCKLTLEYLLNSGLRVKRKQAELALSLHRGNHKEVRQGMFQFKGWQGRYSRLDDEGMKRSKEIIRLRHRMAGGKSNEQLALLNGELQRLREEHALQRVMGKCRSLRVDMRKSLSQGACVSPCWCWCHFFLGPQWHHCVLPTVSVVKSFGLVASRFGFHCSRFTSYQRVRGCGHQFSRNWQEIAPKICMLQLYCCEFFRFWRAQDDFGYINHSIKQHVESPQVFRLPRIYLRCGTVFAYAFFEILQQASCLLVHWCKEGGDPNINW